MAEPWPATLPTYFLVDSYREGSGDGRIFDEMDAGPPAIRNRTSAVARPASGDMVLTAAQVSTLRTFVTTSLLSGSLVFSMANQVDEGGSDYLCRFTKDGLPEYRSIGAGLWRVSFSFEILP